MKRPTFDQLLSEAIPSHKSGVYYLNAEVKNSCESNPVGFYQYTKKSEYKNKSYKCGQTKVGAADRIAQQRSASITEDFFIIVGWIPSDLAVNDREDQRILRELHDDNKCTLLNIINENVDSKEWAIFPDDNPEEVILEHLHNLENGVTKKDLKLSIWQLEALDKFISSLSEGKRKIMAELAARFGKTLLYLALFDSLDQQVMVVGSYYLTALSSFKKEIYLYQQFSNFVALDLYSETFEPDFAQSLILGKKIVVIASLCGDKKGETIRNNNAQIVSNFSNKITVIDEADYGAHTEKCVPFVNLIGKNAPVILTTGTNSERAKGDHKDLDFFFKVTYLDMLMKASMEVKLENTLKYDRALEFEKNLSKVNFYRYDWSRFVSSLDKSKVDLNPSFSKSSKDVQKSRGFWSGLYKSFIGESPDVDANDYSLNNCLENDVPRSVMQFVTHSMTIKQLKNLESLARTILGQFYDVYVISGSVVKGEDAEQFVKDKIRIATMKGKHVWIIASQMCQRSFSIPEINVVLLTYGIGDVGATIHKMSRALTAGTSEKIGHIISLSIDGNRDDKIAPMMLDVAKQVAEHEGIDIITALRKVMKTLPIFQMGEDGYNLQLDVDDYSKEIFSASNSQRIVMNNDRLMYDGCLDEIDCDLSQSPEKVTTEKVMDKGKTFTESNKTVRSMTSEERSIVNQRRSKLNGILDRTAYCIREIRKHKKEINFDSFVNILETNRFVTKSIGTTSKQFRLLIDQKYIDLSLFSILINSES